MNHFEVFGNALWIGMEEQDIFPLFRKNFTARDGVKDAEITLMGLGTYVFYVNGRLGTEDLFQPINSNYEHRDFPKGEVMGVRSYVNSYDVTDMIGEISVLRVYLAQGWYCGRFTFDNKVQIYGDRPAVSWILTVEDEGGKHTYTSTDDNVFAVSSEWRFSNEHCKKRTDYRNITRCLGR